MTSYVYIIPRATSTIHTHTQTHTHKEIHSKTLLINKDGILNFSNSSQEIGKRQKPKAEETNKKLQNKRKLS